MTTGLAPVESLEELWKLDFHEADKPEDKMCIRREHQDHPVKAVCEALCLACGRFCGYFCAIHEREYISVIDRNQKGHWIACGHCKAKNLLTFMPIG